MSNVKNFFSEANFYTPFLGWVYFILAFPLYLIYGLYLDFGLLQSIVFYILITLSLFMSLILVFKDQNLISLLFIFFMGVNFIQIYFSDYSNISDLGYVIRTLGVFSGGFLFFKYMRDNKLSKIYYLFFYIFLYIFALSFDYKNGQYLSYSDSFVILSFLLISIFFKYNKFLIIIFLFSLFMLFLINSRSAILFFFFSFFFFLFYIKGIKNLIFLILTLFPPVVYFLLYISSNPDNFKDYRILVLLFDTSSDTSLNARLSVNNFGIEVFKKNPVFGDFGVYRVYLGDGLYAHNFISFLAEFGIFGVFFIFYFLFLFGLSMLILLKKKNKGYCSSECFLILCVFYSLMGVFLSKSYIWLFLYFTIGVVVSFLSNHFKRYQTVN